VVESGPVETLWTDARHPYTRALLAAMPSLDPNRRTQEAPITGDPPNPIDPPSGCRFHTRCWKAQEVCKTDEPPLIELAPGRQAACHFPENIPGSAETLAVI
jgi:oligopeptide/dipeptide ABC transporter ATP-binding protein